MGGFRNIAAYNQHLQGELSDVLRGSDVLYRPCVF